MFRTLSPRGEAALFYAIALGFSALMALLAAPLIGRAALLLTMFTPAIAVLAFKALTGRLRDWRGMGLGALGLRQWPAALVLPALILGPGYLVLALAGGLGMPVLAAADLPRLVVQFGAGLVIGACLGALGEEIGWRGFLLPRLAAEGDWRGAALVGFLHGFWHVPLILWTPYYHPVLPAVIAVPIFLALVTASGPVFAWLRWAGRSVVPVAICHSAFNSCWEAMDGLVLPEARQMAELVGGETGAVSFLALVVLGVALLGRPRRQAVTV